MLQKNDNLLKDGSYEKILNESIKCHYNDITQYFIDRINLQSIKDSNIVNNYSLKHYNFSFIQESFINKDEFIKLCKYDYFYLVSFFFEKIKYQCK